MQTEEITPRETAMRLGVRLDGVYSLLWAGKIRGRKVNGRWLISAADVGERIRAQKQRQVSSRRAR
jgi:excisionase family DNA binding protein